MDRNAWAHAAAVGLTGMVLIHTAAARAATYYLGGMDPTSGGMDGNGQPLWLSASWVNLQAHMTAAFNLAGDDEIRIAGGVTLARPAGTDNHLLRASGDASRLAIGGEWNADWTVRTGGSTVLDAQVTFSQASLRARVLRIESPTTLMRLDVTGGGVYANGAGIYIASTAPGTRLSHVTVRDNYHAANRTGCGVYNAAAETVLEYCRLQGNGSGTTGKGSAGGIYSSETIRLFLCRIQGNKVEGSEAGGLYVAGGTSKSLLLFGSLVSGNSIPDAKVHGHAAYCNQTCLFINSTIADNATAGTTDQYGLSGWQWSVKFRNCVFSDNEKGVGYNSTAAWTDGHTIEDEVQFDPGGTRTNEGENYSVDPLFKDRANGDYSLTESSKAVGLGGYLRDASVTFSGGAASVSYVDANNDSAYTALTDVIVHLQSGAAPASDDYLSHFIYTTDLAGNPRVGRNGIDAGAYQWQAEAGTLILVR